MTRQEILRRFPNARESFIRRNLTGPEAVRAVVSKFAVSGAEPERDVEREDRQEVDHRKAAREGSVRVRITSFRCQPIDPDNAFCKPLVDALRYHGLIRNDSPDDIELTVAQCKVAHRHEERTEVMIAPIVDVSAEEAANIYAAALQEVRRE